MRNILLFLIFTPHLCFSQLTTYHVMRAINGSTFDVRTAMPNIPNGQILVGNASGVGTAVTMSGDATLSNTGVLSLNTASAGYSKWITTGANIYRSSFVGIGQTSPTYDLDIRGIKGIKLTTAAFGSVPDPGSVANDFISLTPRGFDLTMDAQNISAPFTPPSLGIAVAVSRPQPAAVFKNAGSGAALLIADGEVGILNASPIYPLDVTGDINLTGGIRISGTASSGVYLRGNGTKFVSSGLLPADLTQSGASTNQVLGWNGSIWTPQTNTSESTSIGAFNNTGTSNGLSLSGTALSLHAATISTPGGFNITQQTVYAGTGTKRIVADNGVQLDVDDELGTKSAGIRYTELDGANTMAQITVSSPDADHGTIVTKVEDGAATLVTYQEIGSLDDKKGIYEGGGLYEDVKSVTTGTYTVLYGDRNLHLDGTSMVVTLQTIGTGAGETKPGRVITFFNDNATSVTINGGGGQDIVDASSLTLIVNTGVTLIASGTKWIIKD